MKKLVVVLAAALLGTGIVATQLWLQLRQEREQSAALQVRMSAMEARLASVVVPATPAPTANAGPGEAQASAAAPQTGRQPAARPAAAALLAGVRDMMASPEAREMRRTQLRMTLPQRYPDLGKELHLSPAEVDKLFDLLARQQTDLTADAMSQLGNGRLDAAAIQEMQRKAQEQRQANDAELAATLGGKYTQWQDYQQTLPTRQEVNRLQTMLSSSGNALSEAQNKSLIAALAAEQARIDQETRSAPRGTGDPQTLLAQQTQRTAENNQRLLGTAAAHLNPQQLDSYKRMLDQQQNVTRMLRRLGAQGAAPGQAPAPPPGP